MSLLQYTFYRQVEIQQTSIEITEDIGLIEESREKFRIFLTSHHQLIVAVKDTKHWFIENILATNRSLFALDGFAYFCMHLIDFIFQHKSFVLFEGRSVDKRCLSFFFLLPSELKLRSKLKMLWNSQSCLWHQWTFETLWRQAWLQVILFD
jgi:hypothetical protein